MWQIAVPLDNGSAIRQKHWNLLLWPHVLFDLILMQPFVVLLLHILDFVCMGSLGTFSVKLAVGGWWAHIV